MIKRLLSLPLLVLLTVVLSTAVAFAAENGGRCSDPRMALDCPPVVVPQTPAPSASASVEPSVEPSTAAEEGEGEVAPQPSTAAEEWGGEAAESSAELARAAADRYGRTATPQEGLVQPFALTFAIGLVIFAVVLMMTFARGSRAGRSPQARQELADALPRLMVYVPLMLAAPGAVMMVSNFTRQLGDAFALQSGASFGSFLIQMADGFSEFGVLELLGKAFLALLLTIMFIISLVVWMVEDLVAEYALWLLTALVPIAAALSLWPSNRRMLWRIIGVVIGCALVPAVTRFAFWAMFQMLGDVLADGMSIMALLQSIVVVALATSMPVVLGYVMPAVMPNGAAASDGVAGNWKSHARTAGAGAQDGVQRLTSRFRGGSNEAATAEGGLPPRASAGGQGASAGRAAAARPAAAGARGAAAGGGAATGGGAAAGGAGAGGAAAGGGAAAAGPVGVAVAGALVAAKVAKSGWDTIKGASRESALRMNTASGGGYGTDPDTSSPLPALPGRRDRDGDGVVDQVDQAEAEPVTLGPRYSNYSESLPGRSGPPAAPSGVSPVVTRPGRSAPAPTPPTRKGPPAPPPPPTPIRR